MPRPTDLYEIHEAENHTDVMFIPDLDNSGESDNDEPDDVIESHENCMSDSFPSRSYHITSEDYNNTQKKLEKTHEYVWVEGEQIYENLLKNEVLLSDSDKKKISNSSFGEIFEFFFSAELKKYLIEATKENGYDLSSTDLDTFLGIIIFSVYNVRSAQRDYWSKHSFLKSDIVSEAMSQNKFELIKKKLKCSKLDRKDSDKIWRV